MRSSMRAAQGPWPTRRKQPRNRSALGAMDPGLFLFAQRFKLQAASIKPQAASIKLQAASIKLHDPGPFKKFHGPLTEVLYQDKSILWMLHMKRNLVW